MQRVSLAVGSDEGEITFTVRLLIVGHLEAMQVREEWRKRGVPG